MRNVRVIAMPLYLAMALSMVGSFAFAAKPAPSEATGLTDPVVCPCKGQGGGGKTWGDTFQTAECSGIFDQLQLSETISFNPPHAELLVSGNYCRIVAGGTVHFVKGKLTPEEAAACDASLRQIAAKDGVTCLRY